VALRPQTEVDPDNTGQIRDPRNFRARLMKSYGHADCGVLLPK